MCANKIVQRHVGSVLDGRGILRCGLKSFRRMRASCFSLTVDVTNAG